MKRFVLSYSGGKDSVLALHRMVRAGWQPHALLTTYHAGRSRTWFHGLPVPLLERAAASLGVPLSLAVCGEGEDYNARFTNALRRLRAEGAEAVVFGDIDLQAHRDWCEARCREAGLEAVLPLWMEGREALVREFLDAGYSTMLKVVRLRELPESFLGRVLDRALVEEIQARGADACGENGEYHTMVFDGPLFRERVELRPEPSSTTSSASAASES